MGILAEFFSHENFPQPSLPEVKTYNTENERDPNVFVEKFVYVTIVLV